MSRFTPIFVCLILLVSSCGKAVTPEELGKSVFQAFQNEDVELALSYILYSDDYKAVFSSADISPDKKEELIKKYNDPTRIDELVSRFKKRFKEIIQEGNNLGIIWKDAKLDHIKPPKIRTDKKIESGEIYIVFSYKEHLYEIRLDDCINTPDKGWLMSDEPSFSGEIDN